MSCIHLNGESVDVEVDILGALVLPQPVEVQAIAAQAHGGAGSRVDQHVWLGDHLHYLRDGEGFKLKQRTESQILYK